MTTPARNRSAGAIAAVLSGVLIAGTASCSQSSSQSSQAVQVRTGNLFNSTAPDLIRRFEASPQGRDVAVDVSYVGTTTLTHQANLGTARQDLILLSSPTDAESLRRTHTASATSSMDGKDAWASSVMVIMVRKGNPKHIRTWNDLARPGVRIVSVDPGTAGGGRWNLAAVYGSSLRQSHSHPAAVAFTKKVIQNITTWTTGFNYDTPIKAFAAGSGDVMIADEGQAITARRQNPDLDYVIPSSTMRVDYPWAVMKDARPKTSDFLKYIRSTDGQRALAENGWRPREAGATPQSAVDGAKDPNHPYPAVKDLFTINQVGGWPRINQWLFDGSTALMQTQ